MRVSRLRSKGGHRSGETDSFSTLEKWNSGVNNSGIPIKANMVAVLLLAEGRRPPRLLLLRRTTSDPYAPGSRQILYGHIEAGETAEQTVVREIGEETGLTVKSLFTLNETFTFYEKVGKIISLVPVFVAIGDDSEKLRLDPGEHIEAEWLELGEARRHLIWPAQRRALDVLGELMESGGLPEIMRLPIPGQVR